MNPGWQPSRGFIMNTKKTFRARHLKVSMLLAILGFYVIFRAALPFILVWQEQNFILFPSALISFSAGLALIGFGIALLFYTSSNARVLRYKAITLFAFFLMALFGQAFEGNMRYNHYDLYLAEKGYKPCPNTERWAPPHSYLLNRRTGFKFKQIKYRTWWRDSSEPCDKIHIVYNH